MAERRDNSSSNETPNRNVDDIRSEIMGYLHIPEIQSRVGPMLDQLIEQADIEERAVASEEVYYAFVGWYQGKSGRPSRKSFNLLEDFIKEYLRTELGIIELGAMADQRLTIYVDDYPIKPSDVFEIPEVPTLEDLLKKYK